MTNNILYYQEHINDVLDLQEEFSIEEIGLLYIIKVAYIKKRGQVEESKILQYCRYYGNKELFFKTLNKFCDKIEIDNKSFFINKSWDEEIKRIEGISEKAKKMANARWEKERERKRKEREFLEKAGISDLEELCLSNAQALHKHCTSKKNHQKEQKERKNVYADNACAYSLEASDLKASKALKGNIPNARGNATDDANHITNNINNNNIININNNNNINNIKTNFEKIYRLYYKEKKIRAIPFEKLKVRFSKCLKVLGSIEELENQVLNYLSYLEVANWRQKKDFGAWINDPALFADDWVVNIEAERGKTGVKRNIFDEVAKELKEEEVQNAIRTI
jgi:hypothetical protein